MWSIVTFVEAKQLGARDHLPLYGEEAPLGSLLQ